MDLFNPYSDFSLMEQETWQGFVIGESYLNNIRYAEDTELIKDSEIKLQILLDKVVEEIKKKKTN